MTSLSLHPEILDALHPKATTPAEHATVRDLIARFAHDETEARELAHMLGVES